MAAFAPRLDPSSDAYAFSFVLKDTGVGWDFALGLLEQGVELFWSPQQPKTTLPLVTILARVHPLFARKTLQRQAEKSQACQVLPRRDMVAITPKMAKRITPQDCALTLATLADAATIARLWETLARYDQVATQWVRVLCDPAVPGALPLKQGAVSYLPQNSTNRHVLGQRLRRFGLTTTVTQLSPNYHALYQQYGSQVPQTAVRAEAADPRPDSRRQTRQTRPTAGTSWREPARPAHSRA